ncbi:hypothetical protein B9G98_01775 [Wickerhamiella sorbophila]|uniref:Inhibitor I9 domain-containing protein n=1 Tax=Wickerhamiella sorbophila TaxID=45607 RepID=A0A2T0FGP7_9ASCO|nr:hypothetical protein B9G98_01775 [Wickerhamiella sorbophila]PRT54155.1 hypothetical protein B9G98_01775 [Wickerhamiella sorbophila]
MSSSSYIVRLSDSATDSDLTETIKQFESKGGKVSQQYSLFRGFAGSLPEEHVSALEAMPHVSAVEKDQKVSIN